MARSLEQQFAQLTDLADERLNARILFATDEWFAPARMLLQAAPPKFDPNAFCEQGKVMDGWETRRRRLPGHDWCIIELGLAGYIHGLEFDTAYFTGNQVPAIRVLASELGAACTHEGWLGSARPSLGERGSASSAAEIAAADEAAEAAGTWVELVPMSPLRPGYVADGQSVHRFAVPPELASRRLTHVRLNTHPDGGIARFRVWGVVARDFASELASDAVGRIDLLSALNGGRAIGCSNRHYGEPRNLLRLERGANMGEGWETARNPRRPAVIVKNPTTGMVDMPGACDWCVLRLCAIASAIDELRIDTQHFKGNFPESVLFEACFAPVASNASLLLHSEAQTDAIHWEELLPRTPLGPDREHVFSADELCAVGRISHLRMTIFPDGGIMRLRAFGHAVEPMPSELLAAHEAGARVVDVAASTPTPADAAAELDAHLDWSAKQGRILTGGGPAVADSLFSAANGFDFNETELPHHHLLGGTTHDAFAEWRAKAAAQPESAAPVWMVGAWKRPLFFGGWEHSSEASESCYNLQTPSLFVDIRIPTSRCRLLADATRGADGGAGSASPLQLLNAAQLRVLARQHAFGGYTACEQRHGLGDVQAVCTRHHCIDWNFVGAPRPRPNKWRAQPRPRDDARAPVASWKEWSFATDADGQSYYVEQWERHAEPAQSAAPSPLLALRAQAGARDCIIVVSGDHFCYLLNRSLSDEQKTVLRGYGHTLVGAVDAALAAGDRALATACLSLHAGHGRVSEGWLIDASLQPWHEGVTIFEVLGPAGGATLTRSPSGFPLGQLKWNGMLLDISESSFASAAEIDAFLRQQ